MGRDPKILLGLMQRRGLETEFRQLAGIVDPEEQARRAQDLAGRGPLALSVLLAMLDTGDPQLRGGLGQVALRLDRAAVTAALKEVAWSQERPEQARLTALTLLDRFLHEPLDDALLAGFQDPAVVARQSLRELAGEAARNPLSVIEYLNQLAEQPPDVPRLMLRALRSLPPDPHLVTLLRMFAQGQDAGLAAEALEQLGKTRTQDAAGALASLIPTLPPALAPIAERGLRKLGLSGLRSAAVPPDAGWRALLSPIAGDGGRAVWFLHHADGQAHGFLLGLVLAETQGVSGSFGSDRVPLATLPMPGPLGTVHGVADSAGGQVLLREEAFDTGRQAVYEALQDNWRSGHPTPLEYRLFNHAIWLLPFKDARSRE